MINRDPKCIFVASSMAEATVVANWPEHEGIPVQVMDAMTLGGHDRPLLRQTLTPLRVMVESTLSLKHPISS